jgi:hypothetical protein
MDNQKKIAPPPIQTPMLSAMRGAGGGSITNAVWAKWFQLLRDGVNDTNDNPYVLPIASAIKLGGIRVGQNLTIDPATGILSANSGLTPAPHELVGNLHTAVGLTAGHFLKALSAISFGFAAITKEDIPDLPYVKLQTGNMIQQSGGYSVSDTGIVGKLGINCTPSAWHGSVTGVEELYGSIGNVSLTNLLDCWRLVKGATQTGADPDTGWVFNNSLGVAHKVHLRAGSLYFAYGGTGTVGTAVTWVDNFTFDANIATYTARGLEPYVKLINTVSEDVPGGRESRIYGMGLNSEGTGHTLGYHEFSYQGEGNPDFTSQWRLYVSNSTNAQIPILTALTSGTTGLILIPGMAGAGGFVKNAANGLLSGNNNVGNGDLGNLGTAGKIAKFAALGLADSVITEASGNIGIGMTPSSIKLAVAGKLEAGKFLSGVTPGAMRFTNDVNEQTMVIYGEGNIGNAVAYFGTTHYGLAAYTSSTSADIYAFMAGLANDPKAGTGTTPIFKVMANQRVGINIAGAPLGGLHIAGAEPQLYLGLSGVVNACIASDDGITMTIDADNTSTGTFFAIKKDGPSYATSTMLAIMYEDGSFNLRTDGAPIKFGVDDDVVLTHVHNVGLNLTGKLGINCTPSAWHSSVNSVMEMYGTTADGAITQKTKHFRITKGAVENADGTWIYQNSAFAFATKYNQYDGSHWFSSATLGANGAALTWIDSAYIAGGQAQFNISKISGYFSINGETTSHLLYVNYNVGAEYIQANGKVGINCTPSAWHGSIEAVAELKGTSYGNFAITNRGAEGYISKNAYSYNSSSWKYLTSFESSLSVQNNGVHYFYSAVAGTAGNVIPFKEIVSISLANGLVVNGLKEMVTGGFFVHGQTTTDLFKVNIISGAEYIQANGKVGINCTPSAWHGSVTGVEELYGLIGNVSLTNLLDCWRLVKGATQTGADPDTGWVFNNSLGYAHRVQIQAGSIYFSIGGPGTVGNPVTWTNNFIFDGVIATLTQKGFEPYINLINSTHEDTYRESRIYSKGFFADGTACTLGYMEFTHQGSGEPDFASMWKLNLSDTVGTDTNVLLCYASSGLGYVMIPGMAGAGGFVKNAANGVLSGNNGITTGDITGLFANPTGTVGLTVVNGTATTAMRSDAAPALSQAITPTWTGNHLWGTTYQAQFRDSALYISSKNDGYLDFDADTGFRFNTGKVGIGTLYPGWSPSLNANDSVLSIVTKSPGYEAYLELCGNVADTGGSGGVINFMNLDNSSAANYKHVSIGAITIGATAHHRGADLVFYTKPDNGTITEKLRINSVGNVGIGTTIPTALLHVNDSAGNVGILVDASAAPNTTGNAKITFKNDEDHIGYIMVGRSGLPAPQANATMLVSDSDNVIIKTSNTVQFMVTPAGNVGIGTSIFGTNSVGELCIANGTAPTALVANAIQIFSVDSSDNAATLGLFLEQAMTSDGNTRYLKIKINGEELIWQLTLVT